MMTRLSSNLTLVFKMFIPTLWISFFGLFGVAILVTDRDTLGILGHTYYRIGYFLFFFTFVLFFYITLIPLKRVEFHAREIFVTNYFKTIKFPIQALSDVSELNMLLFTVVTFKLKQKGNFGQKIRFIAQKDNYKKFILDHADYLSSL